VPFASRMGMGNIAKKKERFFLALNFRLAVNMLQLIHAVKKHKN
jgi:hypothetical protein